jgi:ferric enterobactin receptor
MAVKRQSRDKTISYGVSVTNLFNRYVNQLTTAYGPNFNQSNLRQIPLRSFGVTVSYKFGKQEAKNKDKEEDNSPVVPSL